MYIKLIITLVVFIVLWIVLRHYTRTWVQRPLTLFESVIAGVAAWLFVVATIAWGIELVYMAVRFLTEYNVTDLWTLIIATLLTGYGVEFVFSSRSELVIDETIDFIKDALQFRRSAQHRITVLELLVQRRAERNRQKKNSLEDIERAELNLHLKQDEETVEILENLKNGKVISLTSHWKTLTQKYVNHKFYEAISEIKIDPHRKQLMLLLDLHDYTNVSFEDDITELKLYREIYDFLVLLQDDPRLKAYTQFIESIYLMCRRLTRGIQGEEFFTPFIKVGVRVDDIRETIGNYFNPRKLPTIAAIAFKKGLPV